MGPNNAQSIRIKPKKRLRHKPRHKPSVNTTSSSPSEVNSSTAQGSSTATESRAARKVNNRSMAAMVSSHEC